MLLLYINQLSMLEMRWMLWKVWAFLVKYVCHKNPSIYQAVDLSYHVCYHEGLLCALLQHPLLVELFPDM